MSVAVVIPNHQPHLDFLQEWDELKDAVLYVVQDSDDRVELPAGFQGVVAGHADIAANLGADAWIIPRGTSACRSYGYLAAWRDGHEFIATLDNDCYPEQQDYWLAGHIGNLTARTTLDWVPSGHEPTRGFPYGIRDASEVWLSHGLWSGVPDLDAATSLQNPRLRYPPASTVRAVPRHNMFPVCGMNLAWRRELTPALYFGLFGPAYGFDQYDDIFAGVLAKKVLDVLGHAAVTGAPSVEHRKQSNVYVNLVKQAPGLELNEQFWQAVATTPASELTGTDVAGVYYQLLDRLDYAFAGDDRLDGWLGKFTRAARVWLRLFAG